jgi:hypothetical protein
VRSDLFRFALIAQCSRAFAALTVRMPHITRNDGRDSVLEISEAFAILSIHSFDDRRTTSIHSDRTKGNRFP